MEKGKTRSDMEDRHLIVTYCRFTGDRDAGTSSDNFSAFPKNVQNRMEKTCEVFARLEKSHADDEFIRILFFGQKPAAEMKRHAASLDLPQERIEADAGCGNIVEMVKKIWERIRTSTNEVRVYFVLSNWQWVYVEPLLKFKGDDRFRFFFEGALDESSMEEIEAEKRLEKGVASIDIKESRLGGILDKVGGSVSSNLKG